MSQIVGTVTETTTKIVGTKCDLCGVQTVNGQWVCHVGDWGHDFHDVTIKYVHCNTGPEQPVSEETTDLCPDCWIGRVKPSLLALGVKFRDN